MNLLSATVTPMRPSRGSVAVVDPLLDTSAAAAVPRRAAVSGVRPAVALAIAEAIAPASDAGLACAGTVAVPSIRAVLRAPTTITGSRLFLVLKC
ncbi:hypothetical protein Pa4123_04760 [Phytohabitans aurantiacus]|uniref:Uncharacterized protein n=1 Tax=Phytohabitans aurantiacus TaxID=3016789 RepID=A0ABQ5QN68_9ACTN|nr:hypothetical protein Pa4123_04760 [Phytohabitans aurantiacus]